MSTEVATTEPKQRVRVPAAQARRPDGDSFLAVIAEAARDPRCDVQKMQALLDMQRQVEDREAKKAFNVAFIALQAKLPNIARDGKIEIKAKDSKGDRTGPVQQSTPYATFNNIMKAIKPLLTAHGFALSFATEPVGERLLVKGRLEGHGDFRETSFPLPAETSGSKNNVQGWGSSMSYGKRYCTIALLNIVSEAIEDADTDGHRGNLKRSTEGFTEVPEKVTKVSAAQVHEIGLVLEDAGVSLSQFCTRYGIAKVPDLPAELFDAAIKALNEHKAKKGTVR